MVKNEEFGMGFRKKQKKDLKKKKAKNKRKVLMFKHKRKEVLINKKQRIMSFKEDINRKNKQVSHQKNVDHYVNLLKKEKNDIQKKRVQDNQRRIWNK